jgi:hypothetical protein
VDLKRSPSTIADAAAEEIRALNHRTLDSKPFTQLGDVSDTANAIATLVQRLPQTLGQVEAGLRALHEREAIRMDDGTAAGVQVANALSALYDARDYLRLAHSALQRATGPMSHMGGLWEDDEDSEVKA